MVTPPQPCTHLTCQIHPSVTSNIKPSSTPTFQHAPTQRCTRGPAPYPDPLCAPVPYPWTAPAPEPCTTSSRGTSDAPTDRPPALCPLYAAVVAAAPQQHPCVPGLQRHPVRGRTAGLDVQRRPYVLHPAPVRGTGLWTCRNLQEQGAGSAWTTVTDQCKRVLLLTACGHSSAYPVSQSWPPLPILALPYWLA